jgi:hypothetical protein
MIIGNEYGAVRAPEHRGGVEVMSKVMKGRKKALALSLALIVALIVPQATFAGEQEPVVNTQNAVEAEDGGVDAGTTLEESGGGGRWYR